jgi:hypothetical protein
MAMLELVRLLFPTLGQIFRSLHNLVVENLLLRHHLQIALRSRVGFRKYIRRPVALWNTHPIALLASCVF